MKIICFGDSNTYGYDPRGFFGGRYDHPWPEILAEKTGWEVKNDGQNGREIPAGKYPFPADCDLLIIMLGTNDLLQLRSPEDTAERMERFLCQFSEEERGNLLLITPPPVKYGEWVTDDSLIEDIQALSSALEAMAQRLSIRFLNPAGWNLSLSHDGVHLTEEGHRTFAQGLIEYLHKGD